MLNCALSMFRLSCYTVYYTMTNSLMSFFVVSQQWVGSSCGLHGPYIFYKAFKFHQNGKPRILSLGDFFFVRCKPEDPICIAELQLLWEERTTKQLLSSSKLYFLPENTPLGRTVKHGEVTTRFILSSLLQLLLPLMNNIII